LIVICAITLGAKMDEIIATRAIITVTLISFIFFINRSHERIK
jgi:hypothetical protein